MMGTRSSQEVKCQSKEFLLPWEEIGFPFSLFAFFQEKKCCKILQQKKGQGLNPVWLYDLGEVLNLSELHCQ